jgi:hypothetical protein
MVKRRSYNTDKKIKRLTSRHCIEPEIGLIANVTLYEGSTVRCSYQGDGVWSGNLSHVYHDEQIIEWTQILEDD